MSGFKCRCGQQHVFNAYVHAHWYQELLFTCPGCRSAYNILEGTATLLREGPEEPNLLETNDVEYLRTRLEQEQAANRYLSEAYGNMAHIAELSLAGKPVEALVQSPVYFSFNGEFQFHGTASEAREAVQLEGGCWGVVLER